MHQKTQNHFLRFSIHLSVRKSRENYRQIYGKSKASFWRNLSTGIPKFFQDNPLLCSFSLQLIFCSEQPFYGNYSTLDSHTNTVISPGVENRDKVYYQPIPRGPCSRFFLTYRLYMSTVSTFLSIRASYQRLPPRNFAFWERHLTVYHNIKNFGQCKRTNDIIRKKLIKKNSKILHIWT